MKSGFLKARLQHVDKKGQIVIAKHIREAAGIKEGSYVYLSVVGKGKVLIRCVGELDDMVKRVEGS